MGSTAKVRRSGDPLKCGMGKGLLLPAIVLLAALLCLPPTAGAFGS